MTKTDSAKSCMKMLPAAIGLTILLLAEIAVFIRIKNLISMMISSLQQGLPMSADSPLPYYCMTSLLCSFGEQFISFVP